MGAKYQVEDFAELDGLEDYHTVEAQWIAPMLGKRDETIADLRQQLADQQRDFNAKMLSVTKELATVTDERDEAIKQYNHAKGRWGYHDKLRRQTYLGYLEAVRERDVARRWASAWRRSAKMWRQFNGVAHDALQHVCKTPKMSNNYCYRAGRVRND